MLQAGGGARRGWRRIRVSALITGLVSGALAAGPAAAYIGPSFLKAPGTPGWQGSTYKDWVKLEAHYWGKPPRAPSILEGKPRAVFSAPAAPQSANAIASFLIASPG